MAGSLRRYLGVPFEPEDIVLTNASIAALAVTLRTVCEPGDEVIIVSPPHYLYEPLIRAAGEINEAVLAGKTPEVTETRQQGCTIEYAAK